MVPVPLYFRIRANSICGSALYHCASKYWKSFELVDFESQTPGVKVDQSCGARFGCRSCKIWNMHSLFVLFLAAPAIVRSKPARRTRKTNCSSDWTYGRMGVTMGLIRIGQIIWNCIIACCANWLLQKFELQFWEDAEAEYLVIAGGDSWNTYSEPTIPDIAWQYQIWWSSHHWFIIALECLR